eukprot:CAMPEP_0113542338 /NCGR_PEP_ID=MMETSP0015_2-20120614/9550_1 /TAXON_ID=2838 /ORGANISM="Odontella" /LENGTH=146 /DNA_ID=CAMNT_0000442381 /DNA_START=246 /DNA_END=686 /DNA_ORIENTATION=+ /assembly_acc=CAM_ASM_000160
MARLTATVLAATALLLSGRESTAFTSSSTPCRATSSTSLNLIADRRAFVGAAAASAFSVVVPSVPAWAEEEGSVDDLAMPSPEEQKAKEDAEIAERLRRKAELQKKMARPTTYRSSFQSEMDKQEGMKKSKEERRNALCEELGRGC